MESPSEDEDDRACPTVAEMRSWTSADYRIQCERRRMLQHRLVLKRFIFLPHVQQAEKTLPHIGDWKVLMDKNESVKKELLLELKMVEMLEHVIGYGPAHTGMAFNPMLEHLAYKLQEIKLLAKV
jgi:hypothetical protein